METPYLDRLTPLPPVRTKGRTARLILGGTIGAAASLLGMRYGWFDQLGRACVWFVPAYYLAVLLHELGHLAVTPAIGFRLHEFSVGPIVIRREAKGFRWHFVPVRILSGGQVQAVPESSANLRGRFLLVLAGGPVATALVFVAIALLPRGPFTVALGLANGLCALTSWLPFYSNGYVTDAKALLLLRGPESGLFTAMLYAVALDGQGIHPRDWDAATVARIAAAGDSPLAASAAVLTICRVLDGGTPDEIVAAAERALPHAAKAVPLHRRMILETAAYVQGLYRRNAGLATAWLEEARQVKGLPDDRDWDADSLGAIAFAS